MSLQTAPISTPEILPLAEANFYDIAAGLLNHEAKIVTYLTMAFQPDNSFSIGSLHKEVTARQGKNPGWVPSQTLEFRYCQESLGPIGCVTKTEVMTSKGGIAAAFKADPKMLPYATAAAGFLAQWSLEFPDSTVQKILGQSQTSGVVRAPENRIKMLTEIYTSPIDGLSVKEIGDALGEDVENVTVRLYQMEDAGLVKIDSNEDLEDRFLTIQNLSDNPERPTKWTPEYELIKQTINQLLEQNMTRLSVRQFLDTALNLGSHGAMDPVKLRDKLTGSISEGRIAQIVPDEIQFNDGKKTKVRLVAEHQEAIVALLEILEDLRMPNAEVLEEGQRVARDIMNAPEKIADLMAKAKRNSPRANSRRIEEWQAIIMSRVQAVGKISLQHLIEGLNQDGIEARVENIRLLTDRLEKRGVLFKNKGNKKF